jgi:hypothetical protein
MSFFYFLSLEFSISLVLQVQIMDVNDNYTDTWGIGLFYLFLVLYGSFLVFVMGLYFCSRDPAERMERWEPKVGSLYEGVLYKENKHYKLVNLIFIFKRVLFAL